MSPSAKAKDLFEQLNSVAKSASRIPPDTKWELDPRTRALVVLGAAICTGSPTRTFKVLVTSALEAGATDEEVLGVLFAVAPSAGESRVVAMTPKVSKALGYDVDDAFERG